MEFVLFQQQGAWRWILRDGVEVLARGLTVATRPEAVRQALAFKEGVVVATLKSEDVEGR